MKGLYPPFGDPSALPRRVLVVAPHPDDEVFGCGGMLAWHTRVGAEVRVVVLSDGRAGDPDAKAGDIAERRVAESRAAGAELGIDDYRFLGYADGALGEAVDLERANLERFGTCRPRSTLGRKRDGAPK